MPTGLEPLRAYRLEAANAREGIKTLSGAVGKVRTIVELEAANAREGIKTQIAILRYHGRVGGQLEAANAREGIKTDLCTRPGATGISVRSSERPRGH